MMTKTQFDEVCNRISRDLASVDKTNRLAARSLCELVLFLTNDWVAHTEEIERLKEATSVIPDASVCFFRDGNKWCCVYGDFINLQESPAGFGDTFDEALENLKADKASVA